MFGTLLIQLPSWHTGGELRIRHGSREARIEPRADSLALGQLVQGLVRGGRARSA